MHAMEEQDMETVSRKKMKPASRYKKWQEGRGGAGFARVYLARYPCHLKFEVYAIWLKQPVGTKKGWQPPSYIGAFTPACINDTEIPPPYVFTP